MNLLTRLLPCVYQDAAILVLENQLGKQLGTFFDLVPQDTLFIVLRHLSKQPYAQRWCESVNSMDALMVLQCGGALRDASGEMMKSLRSAEFEKVSPNEHLSLANLMAPHLERLLVTEYVISTIDYHRIVPLRELIFEENVSANDLDHVLVICGESLKELEIKGECMKESSVTTISSHCKSLESFSISYNVYPATLGPIWNSIGSTLLKLHGDVPEREMDRIALHCSKVQILDICNLREVMPVGLNVLMRLLSSLKSLRVIYLYMLKSEDVNRMTAIDVGRLLDVCSSNISVNFRIFVYGISDFLDYIRIIGRRLRLLSQLEIGVEIPNDLAPSLCNIEELSMAFANANSANDMYMITKSMFTKPLPRLRKLCLRLANNSKLIPIIAGSVSNLRELECSFCCFMSADGQISKHVTVKQAHFVQLFKANKRLRSIKMYFNWIAEESTTNSIVDFISHLHLCSCLNNVVIKYWKGDRVTRDIAQAIRNASVSLRNRSLGLTVNGVRYLPS